MLYLRPLPAGPVYEDIVYLPSVSLDLMQPVRSLDRLVRVLAGPSAAVGRVVSLGVNLLNGLLLWLLARRLMAPVAALLAVGLFWLHPIQSEAVAYGAARGDLLLGTCLLLALLASQRGWILTAGLCAALALTAKETGITAWLLVPLFAWATDQHWTRRQVGLWASASALVLTLALTHRPDTLPAWIGWWYVGGQLAALGRLLLLWPEALLTHTALTIDHDWTWITRQAATLSVVVWVGLMTGSRLLRFVGLWAIAAALPRLLLPLLDGQHERHLYVTAIAVCLALGMAVERL